MTVSVHDVIADLIPRSRNGFLSNMAVHKLAYYCQGWHLAWHGEPLFNEIIIARASGMVVPALYPFTEDKPTLDSWPQGNRAALTAEQTETVRAVFSTYGHQAGKDMGEWQRNDAPWRLAKARGGEEDSRPEVLHSEIRAFFRARADAPASPTDYANRFMDRYVD